MVAVLVAAALLVGCASPSTDDRTATAPTSTNPSTIASVVPGSAPADPATEQTARVVEVTDGDTLVVEVEGRAEDVRLIGINTPERDECFFAEATDALTDLVDSEEVRLVADQTDQDEFGRLLRYVFVGEAFVNEAMVRDGFAQAYRYEPDVARADELDAAQAEAEAAGRGLWAPDACGRVDADAGALLVDRVAADPPGDDTLDANAEYAVVANRSGDEVDLTGWVLKDETATHRFAFPAGFTLPAGATVTVHTGCGSATAADLFWCNEGSAVWNNDGDTAFLLDPNGNVVDTLAY